jgi:hypothetical protein
MPKTPAPAISLHKDIYLAISLLYLMHSLGVDKTVIALGLAASYYLLYRQ